MGPLYNMLDPFGGHGMPGDPMETVLSLQTMSDADVAVVVYDDNTDICHLNTLHTNSCYTGQCDGIGSTGICKTGSCSYTKVAASPGSL
ncbi:hypothetical protein [Longimicrobium sp.]|uniref:hypothetical protein n=1 Tax=Longimicrobium sp. TaxID=2029185 RepID=UPI002BB8D9DC|nr:hypothetical protein [Longimicrobium sp.]HSU15582.1 hypothetical protein [Longimicrobium sp.]